MSVALDANFLISFYNKKDASHLRAVEIHDQLSLKAYGKAYITDTAFLEVINYIFAHIKNANLAVEVGQEIMDSEIEFIEVDADLLSKAWSLFKHRKNLTLTDSTIVEAMKENHINYLISFDSEFKQFTDIQLVQ